MIYLNKKLNKIIYAIYHYIINDIISINFSGVYMYYSSLL